MKELIPRFIIDQYAKKKFNGSFSAFCMFLDISGFTGLTETLMHHKKDGAEVLTEVLDKIFAPIIKEIYSRAGMVTTFAGDALTAVFMKNESSAVYCALSINSFIKKQKFIRTKYGDFNIGVRIGLSYGRVKWGIPGGAELRTYYFFGEAVNGAAASEHSAKINSIIADSKFIDKAGAGNFKTSPAGKNFYEITGSSKKAVTHPSLKKITKKELTPFVSESVINFRKKAEFREVASVFVSYDSRSMNSAEAFLTLLLDRSLRFGGYFNKADSGDKGNIALIIFGAPVSYENNTERALNFILEIQELTKGGFRAGIASGTVYAGFTGGKERSEYTVIGDIVNLSSRLVMSASSGHILVSENIKKDAGPDFGFASEGRKKFKGKSLSIPVFRLTRKKQAAFSIYKGELVGREKELAALLKFISPLKTGKFAGIMYVYGEPGIGKSRLVHEFRSRSGAASYKWFLWPCEEILRKSFNPVIYFLKNYFSVSDENSQVTNRKNFEKAFNSLVVPLENYTGTENVIDELNSGMTVLGGFLGIEWKDSLFSTLDPKDRYENFLFTVKELIRAESMLQPVIIEIEDVHQIDNDSKELISLLCRNMHNYPVALICTSRYDDSGEEFKLSLDSDVTTNKIDLNYLDEKDTGKYCMTVLGTDKNISKDLSGLVYSRSSGNPFFMEQIILDLQDQKMIKEDENSRLTVKKESGESIPTNIQAVLISRLDRLSEEVKNIVQTASVLGREFLVKILSSILTHSSELHLKIKEIEKESIWSPLSELNYIFKHALMRDAAYDMQLRSRHKKLHALAASSYLSVFGENLKEYFNDIAYHYEKAGDIKNAALYLEKAADHAAANFRNEEALSSYDKLMAITKNKMSVKDRLRILINKGDVLDNMCLYEASGKLYSEGLKTAEKLNDPKLTANFLIHLGNNYRFTSDVDIAMEQFRKALDISEKNSDKIGMVRAYSNIAVIYYFKSEYEKSMEYSEKQYGISAELNDSTGINEALGNMGLIYSDTGKYDEALKCLNVLLNNAEKNGLKFVEAVTEGNIGTIHENQGQYENALKCYNRQYELGMEMGNKGLIGKTVNNMGIIHWRNGDFDKAIENFKIALHISLETGDRRSAGISGCNIGSMYHKQGFFDKALEYYDIDHKMAKELGDRRSESIVLRNKGKVYFGTGEYAKAMKYYDQSIKIASDLNIDRLLYNFYLSKAELLYHMKDYNKASAFIKRSRNTAEKNRAENSIYNKIILYDHKIGFRIASDKKSKKVHIESLKAYIEKLSDPAEIASFAFEISMMLDEIGVRGNEYGKKALGIYRALVKKTPDYEYIANLKILEMM